MISVPCTKVFSDVMFSHSLTLALAENPCLNAFLFYIHIDIVVHIEPPNSHNKCTYLLHSGPHIINLCLFGIFLCICDEVYMHALDI